MINYQEIIENLELDGVKNLLNSLDIPYKDTENALIMPTVCHNAEAESASWKLYYYKNTHCFYCFTEDGAMSIFKFLQHFYEARGVIYDWYQDIYKVVIDCSSSRKINQKKHYTSVKEDYLQKKDRKELVSYPSGVLEVFVHYYPIEWLNDNISKESMDKYGILYSITQNKIIIPHFDINNRLVGIRGRALNEWDIENFGKYMPVQIEGKWYSHPLSLNLYGLNKNKENIKKYRRVYVFEAEKSVLQLEDFSAPNCSVAVCGSNFNKIQMDLLMRYCAPYEVILCFDREELEGEDKYFLKLWNICKKYNKYCNMSFVYDRRGLSKMKDSPSDNGEEIFKKLIQERVMVK